VTLIVTVASWLYNRIVYGNLKTQYVSSFLDINKREFLVFLPLILGTLVMGVYPEIFLTPLHMSVNLPLKPFL